ncbi:MAG: DUF309 domain-containing protein [Deltaproteobacteria bacterium]|nr:DUF309 domain-containing protein [Deltaproteobacteria bacterium]
MSQKIIRYSLHPLPSYRYIPGKGPKDESRKDLPQLHYLDFEAHEYRRSEAYLYGLDLFNHQYFYEAHEIWEELWHVVGHRSEVGLFLKSLIQLAAFYLKVEMKEDRPASRLLERVQEAMSYFHALDASFMGMALSPLKMRLALLKEDLENQKLILFEPIPLKMDSL